MDYCYAQSNTEKESLKELSLTLTLHITLITNNVILFHRKSVTTVWHCTNHFVYFKFEVVY